MSAISSTLVARSGAPLTKLGALLLCTSANAQPLQLGPISVNDSAAQNALNHAPPVATMPSASLQDMPQTVNVVDAASGPGADPRQFAQGPG